MYIFLCYEVDCFPLLVPFASFILQSSFIDTIQLWLCLDSEISAPPSYREPEYLEYVCFSCRKPFDRPFQAWIVFRINILFVSHFMVSTQTSLMIVTNKASLNEVTTVHKKQRFSRDGNTAVTKYNSYLPNGSWTGYKSSRENTVLKGYTCLTHMLLYISIWAKNNCSSTTVQFIYIDL